MNKKAYKEKASAVNVGSNYSAKNVKGESKKICSYLQNLVSDHELVKTL